MPTSQWSADDVVDTLFHYEFPADLQAGDYELRLIVYNTETLIPTVEIGVWEPELNLARLRVAESESRMAHHGGHISGRDRPYRADLAKIWQ